MRSLKIIALAAFAMALIAPAFAQNVQEFPAAPVSPTQIATAGVFSTQVEDSMSVHNYGNIELGKWAGFVGIDNNMASLGYAFKVGGLYLGLWYNGNFMSFDNTKEQKITTNYDINTQLKTLTETETRFESDNVTSDNSLQVLIGVAGMGIKVGFHESIYQSLNPDEFYTKTVYENGMPTEFSGKIEEYSDINGVLTPSIEWGMSFGALRPRVAFGLDFFRNNQVFDSRGPYEVNAKGEIIGNTDVVNHSGRNANYIAPKALVGVEFDIKENTTIGLSYQFGVSIYDNDFSNAAGFGGSVKGTVENYSGSTNVTKNLAGTSTSKNATVSIVERSNMSHVITPSFYHETGDGFKLGFLAEVPFTIETESFSDEYTKSYTDTKYVDNVDKFRGSRTYSETVGSAGTTNVTRLTIDPTLAVGASYPLIASKFTVNAGIKLSPLKFASATTNYSKAKDYDTVTTITYDADGKEVTKSISNTASNNPAVEDSQIVEQSWDYLGVAAAAGFTFNFSENMFVDMAVNGGNESGSFVLNITNVKVLFGFKF